MRSLLPESKIMASWQYGPDAPLVSICCIAYNQESYIKDALEGFLIQKTDFPFEILVHDDASTDNTAQIIRQYAKKYPRLFKPIYQFENQYSKGLRVNPVFNFTRALGDYIALCEGDDYWTSPNKLQIQVDEIRKHPGVDTIFHPANQLIDGKIGKEICKYGSKKKLFTISEVIRGDGGFSPTNSLIFRRKALLKLPKWFYEDTPVGDLYLQIFGSMNGGALYIPQNMSVYRVNSMGSWSREVNSLEKMVKLTEKSNIAIELLRTHLGPSFYSDIDFLKSKTYYKLATFYLCNDLEDKFRETISKAYNLKPSFYRVKLLYFLRHISLALFVFKWLKIGKISRR